MNCIEYGSCICLALSMLAPYADSSIEDRYLTRLRRRELNLDKELDESQIAKDRDIDKIMASFYQSQEQCKFILFRDSRL